ncbi:hypothetical protein PG997_009727 [Apiospora hydei]|uniref:EamA domain-containing protein n=1 Tax=Apiospora hydei TaxID=1337664 RepID=A0ABR1VYS0_9PEZI
MSYGSTQGQAGVPAPTDAGLSPTAATGLFHDDPDAHHNAPAEAEGPESAPGATTVWQKLRAFHERNFGLFLVFLAEIFASLMTMTTRLLETGFETKFHALQIIFVRMLATAILGSLYMWIKKVPDFPLGDRSVRGLLFLRGCAGFMGLFCSYYSLSYLNISDSTVISFLVPTVTAFICFIALREPFTINEASAGLIAFIGVLFIARPTFLFPADEAEPTSANALWLASETPKDGGNGFVPPGDRHARGALPRRPPGRPRHLRRRRGLLDDPRHREARALARQRQLLCRAGDGGVVPHHPRPSRFGVPASGKCYAMVPSCRHRCRWFPTPVPLDRGPAKRESRTRDESHCTYSRPFRAAVYTQLVFALILERIVWGTTPSGWSLIGAALIIGAALWVMLQKNHGPSPTAEAAKQQSESQAVDEESSLLGRPTEPGEDNTAAANTRR